MAIVKLDERKIFSSFQHIKRTTDEKNLKSRRRKHFYLSEPFQIIKLFLAKRISDSPFCQKWTIFCLSIDVKSKTKYSGIKH